MRRGIVALAAGVGALLLAVSGSPAAANPQGPAQRDPERYNGTGTGWGYLVGPDEAGMDAWLNTTNTRAIDVEVLGPDSFSVIAVNNSGVFSRTPGGSASWTTNETFASLTSKINNAGLRMIDLERYTVSGQVRYAAAWVDNTGVAAKTWGFWLGQTPSEIGTHLAECHCRLIDIDPIGGGRYDVIMIPNTGVDTLTWGYVVGATQTQVLQWLVDSQVRAVDLEPDGNGTFTAIAVADGLPGGVRFNQTWDQVTSGPPLGRYIHLKQYPVGGVQRFLTVYMKNG